VFAGKAVVVELRGTGVGVGDMVTWKTSDPASGTVVSYTNDGTANTGFVSEQTEPLGQSVALTDPEPPNEPSTYEQHLFFASDPEWQCSMPDAFYGGFQGRPDHCQDRVLMSFDWSLDQIYGFSSFDTRRIETYAWGTAAVKGSYEATITTEQEAMQWVLSITQKPASGSGSTGADSGYSHQSGSMQWDVQVNAGYDTIAGEFAYLNASNPGDRSLTNDEMQKLKDARNRAVNKIKANTNCREKLTALLRTIAPLRFMNLTSRNGETYSPAAGEVFDNLTNTSPLLDRYDSIPIRASGRSGTHDGTVTYMNTSFLRRFDSGLPDSADITINKEFFSLSADARTIHVLHEVFHQFATDTEIADAISRLSKPDHPVKPFTDTTKASQTFNEWLADKCELSK